MTDLTPPRSNRMPLINMLLPLSVMLLSTYNIVVGRAIQEEHRWQALVPTLALTATLPEEQVNAALMTPGTPRDALIAFGPWHHARGLQGERYTFEQVTRNRCRGLMRLWAQQGSAFPLDVTLNDRALTNPSEDACRGEAEDPSRTLILTARRH